jgi:hypothetical protein
MPDVSFICSSLLGAMQVFVGAASVVVPRWTAITIFSLPANRVNAIATRISGSRDLVLGTCLILSLRGNRTRAKFLTRLAVVINLIDVGSAVACGLEGSLPQDLSQQTALACGLWAILAIFASL